MANSTTVDKIKVALRITHTALDGELADQIDACLTDLGICGIDEPDEADKIIIEALKLWCSASFTDDTTKGAAYMKRYDALKACLMMATGYGAPADLPEDNVGDQTGADSGGTGDEATDPVEGGGEVED